MGDKKKSFLSGLVNNLVSKPSSSSEGSRKDETVIKVLDLLEKKSSALEEADLKRKEAELKVQQLQIELLKRENKQKLEEKNKTLDTITHIVSAVGAVDDLTGAKRKTESCKDGGRSFNNASRGNRGGRSFQGPKNFNNKKIEKGPFVKGKVDSSINLQQDTYNNKYHDKSFEPNFPNRKQTEFNSSNEKPNFNKIQHHQNNFSKFSNQAPTNYNQKLRFNQPSPNFNQPSPNFNQPSPNFNQPSPNFNQPSPNFNQPSSNFNQPSLNFSQPSPNFNQQSANFNLISQKPNQPPFYNQTPNYPQNNPLLSQPYGTIPPSFPMNPSFSSQDSNNFIPNDNLNLNRNYINPQNAAQNLFYNRQPRGGFHHGRGNFRGNARGMNSNGGKQFGNKNSTTTTKENVKTKKMIDQVDADGFVLLNKPNFPEKKNANNPNLMKNGVSKKKTKNKNQTQKETKKTEEEKNEEFDELMKDVIDVFSNLFEKQKSQQKEPIPETSNEDSSKTGAIKKTMEPPDNQQNEKKKKRRNKKKINSENSSNVSRDSLSDEEDDTNMNLLKQETQQNKEKENAKDKNIPSNGEETANIDPNQEVTDIIMVAKYGTRIETIQPKTVQEILDFKKLHPSANAILVKDEN